MASGFYDAFHAVPAMIAAELVAARRALRLDGYCTLADVNMDGDYVSPLQIAAHSPSGPVLLAYHWLDAETARAHHAVLRKCGYLEDITFNRVVDCALATCKMTRADVYMTQVFHLLPPQGKSSYVPPKHLDHSFRAVTVHELEGRKIVALGSAAANACRRHKIKPHRVVDHPSARGPGRTIERKAAELANAIKDVVALAAPNSLTPTRSGAS